MEKIGSLQKNQINMKTVVFTFLLLCFNLKGFAGHYLEFRISSGKLVAAP